MSEDAMDNPSNLAAFLLDRIGKWGLEWEVLTEVFATLIQKFGVKPEDILYSIRSGLNEWDV